MRWIFLRAAARQIPFLLGRAFEVAIVLSLVCLMFGGLFPSKQPQQRTPVAPQLLDPSMNHMTGRLHLRMTATTDMMPDGTTLVQQPLTRPTNAATVRKFAHLDRRNPPVREQTTAASIQQQPYQRPDTTVPEYGERKRFLQEGTANNAQFDENIYLTKLLSMVSQQLAQDSVSLEELKKLDISSAKAEYAIERDEARVLEDVGAAKVQRVHPTMSKELTAFRKVMLVTASHLEPCHSMMGAHLTMLSVKNKADYAKMHGYGFHWATEEPDPLMKGAWNKIAVLQMLADKYSEAEVGWFLWVDADTLILDMERALPVERYVGKDVIVWGCSENLLATYDALGFNGGTLLLRNGPFLRDLLETLAADYGRRWNTDFLEGQPAYNDIAKVVTHFQPTLFEQAALMHIMYRFPAMQARMTCDNTEPWHLLYRFHDWTVDKYATETKHPWLIHWPGCQFCRASWLPSSSVVKDCMRTYVTVFGFAHNASMKALGEGFAIDIKNMIDKLSDSIEQEWAVREMQWAAENQPVSAGGGIKGAMNAVKGALFTGKGAANGGHPAQQAGGQGAKAAGVNKT